jgi:hypothetical protein
MPQSATFGMRAETSATGAVEWREFIAAAPIEPTAENSSDDAIHREFTAHRNRLVEAGRGKPIVRLAAFLIALSHRNRAEGRDPALIDDELDCTIIADYLGLSVDILALSLMQLKLRGLVAAAPDRAVRLTDLTGLEAVADGISEAPLAADTFADGEDADEKLEISERAPPLCYAR